MYLANYAPVLFQPINDLVLFIGNHEKKSDERNEKWEESQSNERDPVYRTQLLPMPNRHSRGKRMLLSEIFSTRRLITLST